MPFFNDAKSLSESLKGIKSITQTCQERFIVKIFWLLSRPLNYFYAVFLYFWLLFRLVDSIQEDFCQNLISFWSFQVYFRHLLIYIFFVFYVNSGLSNSFHHTFTFLSVNSVKISNPIMYFLVCSNRQFFCSTHFRLCFELLTNINIANFQKWFILIDFIWSKRF